MNGHGNCIRRVALALAMAVLFTAFMPETAHASETESTWIELLETATVNDSGNNLFTLASTSGTFRIKTPQYMRCTKVDMLITHPSGYAPSSVKVRYNNTYYTLTLAKVDAYTTRAYSASIPDTLYADLVFEFNKSGTSSVTYQILSCKVTSLVNSYYNATAYATVNGTQYTVPFALDNADESAADVFGHFQFPVVVTDWQKYDKLVINGSVGAMALNAVRVTVKGLGLPYQMSYAVSNSSGADASSYTWNEMKYYTYDESYKGTSETESYIYSEYTGKILFTITIDLAGVDRTITDSLYCYFTALANPYLGYTVQIMDVVGYVEVADTEAVSWWDKVKAFFTDLLGGDRAEDGEDYASTMESQSQEMQDAVNEMEQVTRPNVDDIQVSIDGYVDSESMTAVGDIVGGLMGNELVLSMVMISLILSLAAYVIFGKR